MKTEQLRCFVAACQFGSFTEAGKAIGLSPSAIAYNVETLEAQLRVALFLRRPSSGVRMTREGVRLFTAVEPLLAELAEIEESFPKRGKVLNGEIIVGCQEGLSWSLVPRAIERLMSKHPGLKIQPKTVFMDEANSPILSGAVDVLLTFLLAPVTDSGVEVVDLCEPQPYALMREGHPLHDGRKSVSLSDLAGYANVFIGDGPALELFNGMYADKGFSPPVHLISNVSTGAHAIVGRCDSVSLRYARPLHNQSPLGDRLVYMPLSDPTRRTEIVAIFPARRDGGMSPKVDAFLSECKNLFADGTMKAHLNY